MEAERRAAIIEAQLAAWREGLLRLSATPVALIAVREAPAGFEVWVPHDAAADRALIVRMLRKIADDLEAQGRAGHG